MMNSFVDQQFRVIGQHMRNGPDMSPISPCGGVSKRRERDELEVEAREEERGMRRPVNLDLGSRSQPEMSRRVRTLRQSSYTSDFDLTPSTDLSPWNDLCDPEVDGGGWMEDRRTQQWTDRDDYPELETIGFQDAIPSLEININKYKSRNDEATADDALGGGGVGGVGRGGNQEGRGSDGGSDSDSGKGTVSDCRQSPTEEISFPEGLIGATRKKSFLDHEDPETTTDNGYVTIEALSEASLKQRRSGRSAYDEGHCIVEAPCLQTDLHMSRESELTLHHDYNYTLDSPLGVTHTERLAKVERYLSPGSSGVEQSQDGRLTGEEEFPVNVKIREVIDSNNNNVEFLSPSQVDIRRCHDVMTPPCNKYAVDTSLDFRGTPNTSKHHVVISDADLDIVSSRRELQAKCQDMYGSRSSNFGSQDFHSRFGSHQNVSHDHRRHDMHGSYGDVYPRYEADYVRHDARNNHGHVNDGHCGASDIYRDVGGRYDASQGYRRRLVYQGEIQNHARVMRGSHGGSPVRHALTHASHENTHDSRQSCSAYSRSPSLIADYSMGSNVSGSINSTPIRRYFRHESPGPSSGWVTPLSSPQKRHRYTRKGCADVHSVSVSESDPEIYHDELDGASQGSLGAITPAQYRRMRSVPYDCPAAPPPRVLDPTHPALQQPFSDQEPATLPRPAKPGRSTAEQQVNSCGKTEAKGHRSRPNRRWTNLGLSSTEPEMDESGQKKTRATGSQSFVRFRIPSLFRSRKDSASTVSRITVSETKLVTGTALASGSTAPSNAIGNRSDRETEGRGRGSGRNAVESGFETGSSLGSVGDISLWSMSLGSAQSVFDTGETTPVPVQGVDRTGTDYLRRSTSVPNPDARSSLSILDRLRARFIPRHKSSSSKDRPKQSDANNSGSPSKAGLVQAQSRDEIQLSVLPLFKSQLREASGGEQMEGDELSLTTVAMADASMTTTFETFSTPTKSGESAVRTVNHTDMQASSASSPATPSSSSSSAAAAEAAAAPVSNVLFYGRSVPKKRAPPSEECSNAVSEMIESLLRLSDFVDISVTSVPSTERTITEAEFKEYRSCMIDAVKEFNQACKQMVIRTPESESSFLQALHHCRQSLDEVADKYDALVDCTSLPADRSKVATPVIAVASSLRETVTVACRLTGYPARDPAMLALRRSANRLVGDLALLMKSVREMNYSRLSRRF